MLTASRSALSLPRTTGATCQPRTSWRATASLIVLAGVLSGTHPADAKSATPDALTVTSNEGVTLCRPKGIRCFIPEVDDPIFIGDAIETTSSGRIEFTVPGSDSSPATRLFLLPRSKIRIDRDTAQNFVEVEVVRGMIGVEPSKDQSFDATFGSMICTVGPGQIAIGYNVLKKRTGLASVSNVSGTCRCLSSPGGDYDIPHDTVVTFKKGHRISQAPLAQGFWSKLIDVQGR